MILGGVKYSIKENVPIHRDGGLFNKRRFNTFQELIDALCSVMDRYANNIENT